MIKTVPKVPKRAVHLGVKSCTAKIYIRKLKLISSSYCFLLLTNYCVYAIIHCMQIFNRLQLIRTERGMSRQQLGVLVNINPQTVGFIERGDYSPSLELAFAIADVFGVSVEQLFSAKPFPSLFNQKGAINE
jgi:putative transcriptional regulator